MTNKQGGSLSSLNNDLIAVYARYFVFKNPQFKGFFSLKKMKLDRKSART
jgi:hypothetical protein